MNPSPTVISLAEQPAYYALVALYADYLVNQRRDAEREYFARLQDAVTYIQPLIGKDLPYMKSWSLRLFTEREALRQFSPEQASAAWRLVRDVIERIGPPAGRSVRRLRSHAHPRGLRRTAGHTPPTVTAWESARRLPRSSPIDYRMVV